MECIELVKEDNGVVSIGGCKLGDKPSLFFDNMGSLCTDCHQIDTGLLGCCIDIDTMRIDNPVRNRDIEGIDIYCRYNKEFGIREIEVYMRSWGGYPFDTLSEYKDLVNYLSSSGRFEVIRPDIHPYLDIEMTCLENSNCEVEFIWSKKNVLKKDFHIQVYMTPPVFSEEKGFDTDTAIKKSERRHALKLGKRQSNLSEHERKEAYVSVAREYLRSIDKKWGLKIEASLLEYRRENLLGAGQLRFEDWTKIYHNAGMTDKEIELYRKFKEPFAAALEDSSDMYRD